MSRAPVGPPDSAFAALARDATGLYEANVALLTPVAAAFLFLPGLAAAILLAAAGASADSPLRLFALVGVLALGAVGLGALTLVALDVDRPGPTLAETLRAAGAQAARVAAVAALSGGLILAGLLAFVLPGLYLMGRFAAAIPALLTETLSPLNALGRAWDLSRGQEWRLAGFLGLLLMVGAVIVLVSMLAAQALEAAGSRAGLQALGRVAAFALVQWTATSAVAALTIASAAIYRWLVALPVRA